MIEQYMTQRENLYCSFILLDARMEPQGKDLDFIHWLGGKDIPLAVVLTKSDKLKRNELTRSVGLYKMTLLKTRDELPPFFITPSEMKEGRDEILGFLDQQITHQE